MEGKGGFIILLSIVALLTLTLAGLVGYLFFVADSPKTAEQAAQTAETHTSEAEKKLSDDDTAVLKLYEAKKYFNLKNEDISKIAVIQVSIEIVYIKKVKGIKEPVKKLEAYDGAIKELIGTYFQNMTLEEVKKPESKEQAKKDLKRLINELLVANEKEKNPIVYEVNFDEWFYQ